MESFGFYEFTAEGLSLERLLNQCAKQSIRLHGVRKVSLRQIKGSVSAADLRKLTELAESRGWKLTVGRARGIIRIGQLAKKRALLTSGILIFFMLCWAALSCVWYIDVRGAGPYTGEVERILKEHNVKIGRLHFLIDMDVLQKDMESQLTGLAWVGAYTSGVRLTIHCVQAQLAKDKASVPGDIVAARDGVITSISVAAGTPKVKVGDVVSRGQVLVRGEERAWNGAVNPIRAEATITARIWYTASAKVSGTYIETKPTGRYFVQRVLCMPFYEWAMDTAPDYTEYDKAQTIQPIGGAFPVWMRMERYEEVERFETLREEAQVKEEAALAATRLVQEKVEHGVRVIDKWVEYSMIKDGGCYATAVLEAIVEIAVAANTIVDSPQNRQM